ncbi:MAG: hypothetical protein GTO04_07670, partial [Planctomycetales bacterium]|nr:hypothetical protein [Planctomycetales bacterium]
MNFVWNRVMQICLIGLLWQTAAADRPVRLTVSQLETPIVSASAQQTGSSGPDSVAFSLNIDFDCAKEATSNHLFVSIADSFISTTLPDSAASNELVIKVPRSQLMRGTKLNCVGDHEMQRLNARTAVFATLICRGPEGPTISETV